MSKKRAALLLLPNLLGEHRHHEVFLPSSVDRAVATLDGLIAESERAGRRFLSRFATDKPARDIPIAVYNKKSGDEDINFFLEPLEAGERWGLVSDAGLPCVADPGHKIVQRARQRGIAVQAFVGPSATMLALMLSGLPGQRFAFHGYLPKDPSARMQQVRVLEKASRSSGSTQMFIEAPHRNKHLFDTLVDTLDDSTWLCVAWDLTLPTQGVMCLSVEAWKQTDRPNLEKKPATFLLYAV